MIRKMLVTAAVATLMLAGFLATGCSSTSSNEPNSLTGSDAASQRAAYFQGHNKYYGYYGVK
jgi:outer membrane biogenesis lipoprotein LolB